MKHLSIGGESAHKTEFEMNRITYDTTSHSLTIYYCNYKYKYRGKAELLRFLEKYQVFDATELGDNELVYMERVFKFNDLHEEILFHTGKVTLRYIGKLINYVSAANDKEFIHKYYKLKFSKVIE